MSVWTRGIVSGGSADPSGPTVDPSGPHYRHQRKQQPLDQRLGGEMGFAGGNWVPHTHTLVRLLLTKAGGGGFCFFSPPPTPMGFLSPSIGFHNPFPIKAWPSNLNRRPFFFCVGVFVQSLPMTSIVEGFLSKKKGNCPLANKGRCRLKKKNLFLRRTTPVQAR